MKKYINLEGTVKDALGNDLNVIDVLDDAMTANGGRIDLRFVNHIRHQGEIDGVVKFMVAGWWCQYLKDCVAVTHDTTVQANISTILDGEDV